jgi:hypothetical protein
MAQHPPSPHFAPHCCVNDGDRRHSRGLQQFGVESVELHVGVSFDVRLCPRGVIGTRIGCVVRIGTRVDVRTCRSFGVRIGPCVRTRICGRRRCDGRRHGSCDASD